MNDEYKSILLELQIAAVSDTPYGLIDLKSQAVGIKILLSILDNIICSVVM